MAPDGNDFAVDCSCKVGALITKYGFGDANADLVASWIGQEGDGESVRTLADRFNRRLLREEMRDANMDIVDGRVENLYELLTDDNRLKAVRMQARSSLEEHDIDAGQLENRFVSHQTLYRHLRNCLEAEKGRNALDIEKERDRIHAMQNRAEAVVDDAVTRLGDGDELAINGFEILINFRITCENCGALHDVTDLIDAGGCDCKR